MSQGLEVLDSTTHLTHEWINELAGRLSWGDRRQVLQLLRLTLAGIRDHVSHEEAAQFAAQLPMLVRGLFYEGWRPAETPKHDRSRAGFLEAFDKHLGRDLEYRGEADIAEVFRMLEARISPGEIRDIRDGLPAEIRALWPA